MKKTVHFYKSGNAYFGREVPKSGYIGAVDTLTFATTIVLMKPGIALGDIKRSLQITIADINLRMKQEKKEDK